MQRNEFDPSPSSPEISGSLQRAVEQVKACEPPEEAVQRAVHHAKEIERMKTTSQSFLTSVVPFAAVAATVAFALVYLSDLRFSTSDLKEYSNTQAKLDPVDELPPVTKPKPKDNSRVKTGQRGTGTVAPPVTYNDRKPGNLSVPGPTDPRETTGIDNTPPVSPPPGGDKGQGEGKAPNPVTVPPPKPNLPVPDGKNGFGITPGYSPNTSSRPGGSPNAGFGRPGGGGRGTGIGSGFQGGFQGGNNSFGGGQPGSGGLGLPQSGIGGLGGGTPRMGGFGGGIAGIGGIGGGSTPATPATTTRAPQGYYTAPTGPGIPPLNPLNPRPALLGQNQAPPRAPVQERPATEQYQHITENDFIKPTQKPLSTFSIDVDTASYSNMRRFLNSGQLPPRGAVRIEEMVNYFQYDYPEPKGDHPITITTDLAMCPWNVKHHLLRVALKGMTIDPKKMPSRNFVFLIDTSGSMGASNKLPLLQSSLKLLVDQLRKQDRVALVAYAGSAGLVLPSTSGDQKDKIKQAIDRLRGGGSTNGGAGIQLAYKVAVEHFIDGGLNRVILGTDGDFNVGTSSEAALIKMIEEKRKSKVFLSVIGMGTGNLKDSQMEKIAQHGNGQYVYIDNQKEARKIFVEQGGSLLPIAKDVKFQIEFNPAMVAGYRLVGYENRVMADRDFNDDKKDAGEMGAGHTVTAFYEIVPAGTPVDAPKVDKLKYQIPASVAKGDVAKEWLTVKLRYKDPEATASKLMEKPLSGKPMSFEDTSKDYQFAASVAALGLVLRDSKYKGSASLPLIEELAASAVGKDKNGHRKEFLELLKLAKKLTK